MIEELEANIGEELWYLIHGKWYGLVVTEVASDVVRCDLADDWQSDGWAITIPIAHISMISTKPMGN